MRLITLKRVYFITWIFAFMVGACGAPDSEPPASEPSYVENNRASDSNITAGQIKAVQLAGNLTIQQQQQRLNQLIGQRIRWTGSVRDVTGDGVVLLSVESVGVKVQGWPSDVTYSINKGDTIEFEGTISSIDVWINIDDVSFFSINPTPIPPDCDGVKNEVAVKSEVLVGEWGVKTIKYFKKMNLSEAFTVQAAMSSNEAAVLKYDLIAGKSYFLHWNASGRQGIGLIQDQFGHTLAVTNPDKNEDFTQLREFRAICTGSYYVFVFDIRSPGQGVSIEVRG